jgi:hypothetical protein
MASINEPLSYYRDSLRDAHALSVSDLFEELLSASGVDAEANRETVIEINKLESEHSKNSGKKTWWIVLRVSLWVGAVISAIAALSGASFNFLLLLVAVALAALDLASVAPRVNALKDSNEALSLQIEDLSEEAWNQMEALNQLFRWNMSKELVSKTFPELQFDDHFSEAALFDLVATYGLDGSLNNGRSILRTQSGNLVQNPLIFYRFLQHWIGSQTYHGSLVIYWTENIRNSQGQMQTVQRSQTLHANVTKPFPSFAEGAAVILGHEAAPNLSFTRVPSSLSGVEDTRFNAWRKSGALKNIEKQAKKQLKSGSGQLTVMSNREFETLFKALDRDHEIEFRLMFTPLAQQEMVKLLNDTSVGHGDDFVFSKSRKTNYVEPEHLSAIDLDPHPSIFYSNDLEKSRDFFNQFNNEFFRSLFFGIAPFLAVPLYTEPRRLPIASGIEGGHLPNSWEVEVMANAVGEEALRHPNSITRNLLSANIEETSSGGVIARLTALGYQGFDRVDFVPVLGGDGNWHQVPVPWVEYLAVERQSRLFVARVDDESDTSHVQGISSEDWSSSLSRLNADEQTAVLRAHLGAAILR